jgi:hypothetical protein
VLGVGLFGVEVGNVLDIAVLGAVIGGCIGIMRGTADGPCVGSPVNRIDGEQVG